MTDPTPDAIRPDGCVCTNDCPESYRDNDCPYCRKLDIYEPCPVIGFGCGTGAKGPRDCDCCTDEQWAASAEPLLAHEGRWADE